MTTIECDHADLVEAVVAMNVSNASPALPASSNEPKDAVSDRLDSGYASQSSTPDSLKSAFADRPVAGGTNLWPRSFRKSKQLRAYDIPIPQKTLDRFTDLREQYAEKLNSFTRSLPNCPSVLMSLQVLGEDEGTAEPWVFVQCDKAVFRKITNFFKQPLIRMDFEPSEPDERYPRLRVLVCPLKPRLLANDEDPLSQQNAFTDGTLIAISGEKLSMSRGVSNGLQIMNDHPTTRATMGGVIMVVYKQNERKLLGMTAGHSILRKSDDSSDEDIGSDLDDDDYFEEESFELDLSSLKSVSESQDETRALSRPKDKPEEQMDQLQWSHLGYLSEASHSLTNVEKNLDWALISIQYNYLSHLNELNAYGARVEEDCTTNVEFVRVVTGRGTLFGILSPSWSYIMLPPGKVLVRAYLLTFWNGALKPGDSGSWVINTITSKIYGHVVATDCFGRGYVIPLHDSFEDIKEQLSVDSVSLPSREDFRSCMLGKFSREVNRLVDVSMTHTLDSEPSQTIPDRVSDSGYSSMDTTPQTSPAPAPGLSAMLEEFEATRAYRVKQRQASLHREI